MSNKENYIRQVANQIREGAGSMEIDIKGIEVLFDMYAVLAMSKGRDVTDEDVHDTWAAWASEHNPTDESIIPFDELSKEIQTLDSKYTKAIREVAGNLAEYSK